MVKRKVMSPGELKELILPEDGEQLGRVIKRFGSELMQVRCADGKVRIGRIRGKLKRRIWIRDNDVVLIAPWEFKTDERCDILWRYTLDQVEWFRSNNHIRADL